MTIETETDFEKFLQIIKSGSTFESLRAAEQLAQLSRKQRKSTDEMIRDAVKEALHAAGQSRQQPKMSVNPPKFRVPVGGHTFPSEGEEERTNESSSDSDTEDERLP